MPARVATLVLALVIAACSLPGQTAAPAERPNPTSSGSPAANTSAPPPSSTAPPPDPNPGPVTRGYAVVVGPSAPGRFTISLVAGDGSIAASAQAEGRGTFTCGSRPGTVTLPLPVISLSNSRAYFLDGMQDVRFLAPNGATGLATRVPATPQQISLFAVSPDDRRIAVNVIDYTQVPLTQRLYVEDLAGGGNHVEVFSATSPAGTETAALWPAGWRAGNLVLGYHSSTCAQGGGPGLDRATSFHIADAVSGRRVATIGADGSSCGMVDPEPSLLACSTLQNDAQLFDWQGNRRQSLSCPEGLGNLSPDGAKLLCGVFSAKNAFVIGLDGSRVDLPPGLPGGFLDSDHVYSGASTAQEQGKLVTLSVNQIKPVAIVGNYRGRLPGSLDVGRGT